MILSLYFVLWLTLKKLQSVTKTKYWHTVFSQLFSFTLRYKLCLWVITLQAVRFYILCVYLIVWTRRSSKCILLVCFGARRACAHTHAHALQPEEQRLSCGFYFRRFIIKHVQQFSNCKDGILQQSTDDWSDSDVKFWSGRNECAPLWREVVLEETRL